MTHNLPMTHDFDAKDRAEENTTATRVAVIGGGTMGADDHPDFSLGWALKDLKPADRGLGRIAEATFEVGPSRACRRQP